MGRNTAGLQTEFAPGLVQSIKGIKVRCTCAAELAEVAAADFAPGQVNRYKGAMSQVAPAPAE